MGWAWREIRDGAAFEAMLAMVRGVRELGMEACVTAGMLTDHQAARLAEAGLTAYNHNLDTSPEHYDQIISTRTYQDRLETLARVRGAGISLCCGGIIGLGESSRDRASSSPCSLASIPTRKACRSMPWWRWKAPPWRGSRPWMPWRWCGWWRWRGS
jgi:biotin synthase-like enzyme